MTKIHPGRQVLPRIPDERFVLWMHVCYGLRDGDSSNLAIISTSQFRKFTRLTNGHTNYILREHKTKKGFISLHFSFESLYFKGNLSVRNEILSYAKLLKGSDSLRREFSFRVNGDIGDEQASAIEAQSRQPVSSKDTFEASQELLRIGDELFCLGFLSEARGAYLAITEIRSVSPASCPRFDLRQRREMNRIILQQHIQLCRIYSKLKLMSEAIYAACNVQQHWRRPQYARYNDPMDEIIDRWQLGHRVAMALTDDGRWGSIETICRDWIILAAHRQIEGYWTFTGGGIPSFDRVIAWFWPHLRHDTRPPKRA